MKKNNMQELLDYLINADKEVIKELNDAYNGIK